MLNLIAALRMTPSAPVILSLLLFFSAIHPARGQNNYPATGDALIHGLTIGAGPGFNVTANTALGASALHFNNGGSNNTAVGALTLYNNIGGQNNTAIGYNAMFTNTNGNSNTALGIYSLSLNTTGSLNTAIGFASLQFNTTGYDNVSVGTNNLGLNTTGNNNTSLGYGALFANNTGYSNVAIGVDALITTTSSSNLVAVGDSALLNNTAAYNTAIGSKTLHANTTGVMNTASGYEALYSNQSGSFNDGSGGYALYSNTGNNNTATGVYTMYYNTSGAANTAYGLEALLNNTTGSYNTGIGEVAGPTSGSLSNTTSIGYDAAASASNSVVIGNSSVTSIGGYAGWTNFSDGRFKKNINHNVPGLAFINKLVPITYNLDIDGIEAMRQKTASSAKTLGGASPPRPSDDPAIKQFRKEKSAVLYTGFVAQDVEQAARTVGYDFSGVDKPKDAQQAFYGLRYSDFVVPLVKSVQELSRKNDSLENALAESNAQLSQRLDQLEKLLGVKAITDQSSSTLSLSSARLAQNIPNPFNQTTLINYYLPQTTGSAMIRITGMNGETIKSMALNGTGAGQLNVQTAQLAAGTYMYTLIVDGNLVDTKKMVVVK